MPLLSRRKSSAGCKKGLSVRRLVLEKAKQEQEFPLQVHDEAAVLELNQSLIKRVTPLARCHISKN